MTGWAIPNGTRAKSIREWAWLGHNVVVVLVFGSLVALRLPSSDATVNGALVRCIGVCIGAAPVGLVAKW